MSDPTTTADTAVSTDAAPAVSVTEPAITPEPITVGTLLARHRVDDTEPLLAVVTSVDERIAHLRDATGYRHTVYVAYVDGNYAWKRALTSPGAGVTAILASLASDATGAESRLRTAIDTHATEMERFRDKVRDVAMEYAERNDWCAEVARALAELGITVEREVTVTGTFSLTMTLPYGTDRPSRSDVLEALDSYDISIDDVEDSE